MTAVAAPAAPAPDVAPAVPRIAFVGEFSAGKSTVVNALLGEAQLPTGATPTQLPPVWFAYGSAPRDRALSSDGTATTLRGLTLDADGLRRHDCLRIERPMPVLRQFELIDTPGLSDPTLDADRLALPLSLADIVVWCTPANQAWRRSEAARWGRVPDALRRRSLLLVTRIDTLGGETGRRKVLRRLAAETHGTFDEILTLDGRAAAAAGAPGAASANYAWRESGATALLVWLNEAAQAVRDDRAGAPSEPGDARPRALDFVVTDKEDDMPVFETLRAARHRAIRALGPLRGEAGPDDLAPPPPEPPPRDAAARDAPAPRTPALERAEPDPPQTAEPPANVDLEPETDSPRPYLEGLSRMTDMTKVQSTDISALSEIAGFIGGCLVDSDSGLMLGSEGGGAAFDLEAAAAGNTEVVRAKNAAMKALNLDDSIEDILITLGTQLHLIRPLAANPEIFLYVAIDKKKANLGMARIQARNVEKTLMI